MKLHAPGFLLPALTLFVVTSCAPRRIPGTDLEDTKQTREILSVMEAYRFALENKDAERILSVISPEFRDNSGTATPDDDLDYATLQSVLPERLERLSDVRVEITVRRIEVFPENKTARAIYTYNSSFRMPGLTARPHRDSEIKEMMFIRDEKNDWKILSGI